jgi:hypothetical protein
MKDLRIFLEHRTVNEVKIKCSQTGEEIHPEYIVYDETSLNSVISRYKQNKEQFKDLSIFFCHLKGNSWVAKTKVEYTMDLGRMSDKFLSSGKVDYSFDDVITLMEDGDTMLIFTKNNK